MPAVAERPANWPTEQYGIQTVVSRQNGMPMTIELGVWSLTAVAIGIVRLDLERILKVTVATLYPKPN
jgi:hypothetical protein